jgi:hypothetical protein
MAILIKRPKSAVPQIPGAMPAAGSAPIFPEEEAEEALPSPQGAAVPPGPLSREAVGAMQPPKPPMLARQAEDGMQADASFEALIKQTQEKKARARMEPGYEGKRKGTIRKLRGEDEEEMPEDERVIAPVSITGGH